MLSFPPFYSSPILHSAAWNANVMAGALAAILNHEGEDHILGLAERWIDLWSLSLGETELPTFRL